MSCSWMRSVNLVEMVKEVKESSCELVGVYRTWCTILLVVRLVSASHLLRMLLIRLVFGMVA